VKLLILRVKIHALWLVTSGLEVGYSGAGERQFQTSVSSQSGDKYKDEMELIPVFLTPQIT
jgi:hypothetical protein